MQRHSISDLLISNNNYKLQNKLVTVCGWVKTRRDSKAGFSFINLSDGSCFETLQLVAPNTICNYQQEILKLTSGCSLIATGELIKSPASGQLFELQVKHLEVTGWVHDPDTYPISAKYHTLEHLRDYLHLRSRTNIIGAVTRVRHHLCLAIHRFFDENGFFWIHTPIITTSDCEGAGQLFRVTSFDLQNICSNNNKKNLDFSEDFFGKEAFLTVSGQLNVEAYCQSLSKVYTFGPTFRAENSNTPKHLAEFWMVEPEIAFADLSDDAKLAVDLLKYLANAMLTICKTEMEFFAKRVDRDCISRLEKIIESDFVYLEYSEVILKLQQSKKKFVFPVNWGLDLQTEHERYLTEEIIKCPVIVINYPKEIKSFYMRINDDNKTVAAMDVLVPGVGEIIGGSQREERYNILAKRMDDLGLLNNKDYEWYLELRRLGTVPHAGFGLGLERILMYITGVSNIRDVIPFPRAPGYAK